jgi:hypothetical protein
VGWMVTAMLVSYTSFFRWFETPILKLKNSRSFVDAPPNPFNAKVQADSDV